MKYDIFISYSRKDIEIVRPILDELEAREYKIWLDLSNIDYGDTFPDRIAEALDASNSLLFMCTPNSLAAPYCKKEIGYARSNGKKIRAILVDGVMPKQGWFALDYQDINCINFTKNEQKDKFFEDIELIYQPEKAEERKRKLALAKEAAKRKVQEEEQRKIEAAVQKATEEAKNRIEQARIRKEEHKKTIKELKFNLQKQRKGKTDHFVNLSEILFKFVTPIFFSIGVITIILNQYYKKIEQQENENLEINSNHVQVSYYTNEEQIFNVRDVSFKMIPVEGGTYTMGINEDAHQVTLSNFMCAETEVTQSLWEIIMGNNPSLIKGGKRPVETVSWESCQAFLKKLHKVTGKPFRLLTEAEWEYAARGGKKSRGYKFSGSNNYEDVAWFQNSNNTTHDVKTKVPNELGIYDMSGNVWEWCQDWDAPYSKGNQTNPTGPQNGTYHIIRGGGCFDAYIEVWARPYLFGSNNDYVGFRIAL